MNPEPTPKAEKKAFTLKNLPEKAALFGVFFLLFGAVIWGVITYNRQIPDQNLVVFDKDFPIQGKHATISKIETYWREPIRAGENADHGVRRESKLIPCAQIVLSGSWDAALALSFRDDSKNLVGDPFSLEVKNGLFSKTGTNEITINSTTGFKEPLRIHSYVNLDINPWSLLVVEGESGTNPSYNAADKKLAEARISTVVRH